MPESEIPEELTEDPVLVRLGLRKNQVIKGLGTRKSVPGVPQHKKKEGSPSIPSSPPVVPPYPPKRSYQKKEKKVPVVKPKPEKVEPVYPVEAEPPIVTTPEKVELTPLDGEGSFFPDSVPEE